MDDRELVLIGRTRSGKRWFWSATVYGEATEHGRTDDPDTALAAAHTAAERMLDGRPAHIAVRTGYAEATLREVNAEKRAARPGKTGPAAPREYVYGIGRTWDEYDREHRVVVSFPITKKTPKRVYYLDRWNRTRYVDRQRLEADGEVHTHRWFEDDSTVYAEPPELEQRPAVPPVDLKALRQAMADAHPDRGGDRDSFMAARTRYERAKQQEVRS